MCSPSAVSRDWVSWPMRWAMTAAMDGVAVPKLAFSQSRNPSFRVVLLCRFAFLILGVVRKGSFLQLGPFEGLVRTWLEHCPWHQLGATGGLAEGGVMTSCGSTWLSFDAVG